MKNPYMRFLSFASTVPVPCDLTAMKLLEVIAACEDYEPLTVGEAMMCKDIASPATLHRKLMDLSRAGLVAHEAQDRKTKLLFTTAKAREYFYAMNNAMLLAMDGVEHV